jgi:hypothetical protein
MRFDGVSVDLLLWKRWKSNPAKILRRCSRDKLRSVVGTSSSKVAFDEDSSSSFLVGAVMVEESASGYE